MKQSVRFTARLVVIFLIFAVLFSYAMFQGGFVSWFLFYSFLPFLLYMVGLTFYRMDNWKVERRLSKKVTTAGETIHVDVHITRSFLFPMYYCVIEEYIPESLMKRDTHFEKYRNMGKPDDLNKRRQVKKAVFPWFKRTIRYQYVIEEIPRGEHQLRALRVKTGDFFGFITKEVIYQLNNKIIAFPYKRPVRLTERAYSFEQGASPSFKLNEKNTNVVSGVREYVPGDRFSWIDWKTTAKSNQMMTKEFEQEKSVDMLIILNAVYEEDMNPLSFEGSVEFSASLLEEIYNRSSQLAFMTLGDGKRYFPFQQDHAYKDMIQQHLAQIRPRGQTPFAKQLERELSQNLTGMLLLIVSHQLDMHLFTSLIRLAQKSKRVVLFYVKPRSQMEFQDHKLVKQLVSNGIVVNMISEDELTQQEFEVNT
ncbi:DUF58 domain-containing protein [Halobacillus shinanisalinarum]|uniref:DUF58 domain-containing protein n=1 Tax=Halobacillus shinanisalinarum TaxID=2932258 RepID=A0ABY4GWA3_9BACI|nr:DUF58 domain-containing protein [Halobacillus shinanisalinarum]UOQ92000.1 DUF58 domain-containing protein [Halobacillus shinanisalinarum]